MSLPTRVTIVEVGPRDGLQSEPELLPTATKIEFIKRSLDAGIRHLEVASFVHPKKVPQMADAEDVIAGLPDLADAIYIGLIMNWKGFERALAAGVHEVGMVIVASDTFMVDVLQMQIDIDFALTGLVGSLDIAP